MIICRNFIRVNASINQVLTQPKTCKRDYTVNHFLALAVNCLCDIHSLDICMRRSVAGRKAIEFSSSWHFTCPLQYSVNILDKRFLHFLCAFRHKYSKSWNNLVFNITFVNRRTLWRNTLAQVVCIWEPSPVCVLDDLAVAWSGPINQKWQFTIAWVSPWTLSPLAL